MRVFNQQETKDGIVYRFKQYQFTASEIALITGKDISKDPCEICSSEGCNDCDKRNQWVKETEEFGDSEILAIKYRFDDVRRKISELPSNSNCEVEKLLLLIPPTLRIFAREGYKG